MGAYGAASLKPTKLFGSALGTQAFFGLMVYLWALAIKVVMCIYEIKDFKDLSTIMSCSQHLKGYFICF
jgi:hypothetical protein